jgi:hypothetical protein
MDILCGNMFTMYHQSLKRDFDFWILNFWIIITVFNLFTAIIDNFTAVAHCCKNRDHTNNAQD